MVVGGRERRWRRGRRKARGRSKSRWGWKLEKEEGEASAQLREKEGAKSEAPKEPLKRRVVKNSLTAVSRSLEPAAVQGGFRCRK